MNDVQIKLQREVQGRDIEIQAREAEILRQKDDMDRMQRDMHTRDQEINRLRDQISSSERDFKVSIGAKSSSSLFICLVAY